MRTYDDYKTLETIYETHVDNFEIIRIKKVLKELHTKARLQMDSISKEDLRFLLHDYECNTNSIIRALKNESTEIKNLITLIRSSYYVMSDINILLSK